MGAVELRNKLIEIINTSDERFLRMINALHKSYESEDTDQGDVVAYTFSGKSLTRRDIVINNKEAIQSIEKGEFKTHTQMRQKYAKQ